MSASPTSSVPVVPTDGPGSPGWQPEWVMPNSVLVWPNAPKNTRTCAGSNFNGTIDCCELSGGNLTWVPVNDTTLRNVPDPYAVCLTNFTHDQWIKCLNFMDHHNVSGPPPSGGISSCQDNSASPVVVSAKTSGVVALALLFSVAAAVVAV